MAAMFDTPSIFSRVLERRLAGPASALAPARVTGAPIVGPSNKELPAGSGTGLDALSAARREALGRFQALRANQANLAKQHGPNAVAQALDEAYERAMHADAEYRSAAASAGLGMFTE